MTTSPTTNQNTKKLDELLARVKCMESHFNNKIYTAYRHYDLTVKIGYSDHPSNRKEAHEAKGFRWVADRAGIYGEEQGVLTYLRKLGFKPKFGKEYFHFCPELIQVLYEYGWPMGDLYKQNRSEGCNMTPPLF